MSAVIHELIGNRLSCIAERGNITESQWVRGGGGREAIAVCVLMVMVLHMQCYTLMHESSY